jgi:hypothetical protein
MDPLRRGYLANRMFSSALDYTHCEMPVTLKLLWGRMRSFDEIDAKQVDRTQTPYFYIGDENPVGPRTWKVRLLLFVKPDYIALFDRVYGEVPHRLNLHVTAESIKIDGPHITAPGRFDLDLAGFVQYPNEFEHRTEEFIPETRGRRSPETGRKQRQRVARLYNHTDGLYRTLLFAKERDRNVTLDAFGRHGIKITTPEYTDLVFLHNDVIDVDADDVRFVGRSGWIRRLADGSVQASVIDGEHIAAFGTTIAGRGPWTYNVEGQGIKLADGPPRDVTVT